IFYFKKLSKELLSPQIASAKIQLNFDICKFFNFFFNVLKNSSNQPQTTFTGLFLMRQRLRLHPNYKIILQNKTAAIFIYIISKEIIYLYYILLKSYIFSIIIRLYHQLYINYNI